MNPRLLEQVFSGIYAITKPAADAYLPMVTSILNGKFDPNQNDFSAERLKNKIRYIHQNAGVFQISEYGGYSAPEDAPEGSIAVVNINDVVMKYDMYCGPAGTKTKMDILQRIDKSKNINGAILVIDSPGGEGYAAKNLASYIRNEFQKPIISYVDDFAASAAYYIAAATDQIIANSIMAQVGSIGTYITLADYTDFWKAQGINVKNIYATKSTDKNKPYKDAIEGDTKLLKEDIDRFNQDFLDNMASYRDGKLGDEKIWGTGKLFYAEDAYKNGLIDAIATWEETVQSFIQQFN